MQVDRYLKIIKSNIFVADVPFEFTYDPDINVDLYLDDINKNSENRKSQGSARLRYSQFELNEIGCTYIYTTNENHSMK